MTGSRDSSIILGDVNVAKDLGDSPQRGGGMLLLNVRMEGGDLFRGRKFFHGILEAEIQEAAFSTTTALSKSTSVHRNFAASDGRLPVSQRYRNTWRNRAPGVGFFHVGSLRSVPGSHPRIDAGDGIGSGAI